MSDALLSDRLGVIATDLGNEHAACVHALSDALAHAVRAGELLLEAKALVAHGEWLPWLADHFAASERTARNYMRLAAAYPALAEIGSGVADLTVRDALRHLAAPRSLDYRRALAALAEQAVHPYLALLPMMPKHELQELADSIKASGLLHPITVDDHGVIIDGRQRLVGCWLAGVEPRYTPLPEGRDPRSYIVSMNLMRKQLMPSERAVRQYYADHSEALDEDPQHYEQLLAEYRRRHPESDEGWETGRVYRTVPTAPAE